jgi:hypothetical protein
MYETECCKRAFVAVSRMLCGVDGGYFCQPCTRDNGWVGHMPGVGCCRGEKRAAVLHCRWAR